MRALLLAATLLAFVAPADARRCASGYHVDSQGHCQPNIPQASRYCPKGMVYQPAPGGWRCRPPGY